MYCTPYFISGNVVLHTGTCFYRSDIFERPCIFSSSYDQLPYSLKTLLVVCVVATVWHAESCVIDKGLTRVYRGHHTTGQQGPTGGVEV
jgi:hypothetical protein